MFFLTVVTHQRRRILCTDGSRAILREAIETVRRDRPFELRAMVLLPDHFHALWVLPEGDADFSVRMGLIKKLFTRTFLAAGGTEGASTPSRLRHRNRGVWAKRFYEHTIRNYRDYKRHLDYIHFNPVKHGHVQRACDWPWSTFHSFVRKGEYPADWCKQIPMPCGVNIEPDKW